MFGTTLQKNFGSLRSRPLTPLTNAGIYYYNYLFKDCWEFSQLFNCSLRLWMLIHGKIYYTLNYDNIIDNRLVKIGIYLVCKSKKHIIVKYLRMYLKSKN